jgi:hypothetical protein
MLRGVKRRMTNADRIRAMTDEELANTWLMKEYLGHNCDKKLCYKYGERTMDEGGTSPDCVKCILDWLKQEIAYNG